MKLKRPSAWALFLLLALVGCQTQPRPAATKREPQLHPRLNELPLSQNASPQLKQLLASAIEQTGITTGYDPAYVSIAYPGGDVPLETGVCSDVIVRAFRRANIDLQKEVHEDMKASWAMYPRRW